MNDDVFGHFRHKIQRLCAGRKDAELWWRISAFLPRRQDGRPLSRPVASSVGRTCGLRADLVSCSKSPWVPKVAAGLLSILGRQQARADLESNIFGSYVSTGYDLRDAVAWDCGVLRARGKRIKCNLLQGAMFLRC